MTYESEVQAFLKLSSSINNQKSIRAIAESLSISEEKAGLAIHLLLENKIVKIGDKGNSEGLQYYI
ncbi:MAG: hypothetical protein K0R94_1518 [Burkholderiales bacterium]|jgi:hypothetical protein|nr:hypothetical protein [Burkholderiales bacterium]